MFAPLKTNDGSVRKASKTLLMTHHGWGKTTTCRYYKQAYGKGLILSGESGLKSLQNDAIDYVHFSSYDGHHDPDNNVYSFRGLMHMIAQPEFMGLGYQWICVDSLTELGDHILEEMEYKHRDNKNRFDKWTEFSRLLIGACKWIRDLPMHVLITCLAGEEMDANGNVHYWPNVPSQKTPKKLTGIFDYVFCGVRHTPKNQDGSPVIGQDGAPVVERFVITDEINGWCGKARDPNNRLKAIERESNIVNLLQRVDMTDEEYKKFVTNQQS